MTSPINDGAQPAYSAPAGGAVPAKKTLSIVSMILGIIGFLLIITTWPAILVGIGAVVTGHLAQRREKVAGKGFWITGLITGYLAIVGGLIWLIASIAILAALSTGDLSNIPVE